MALSNLEVVRQFYGIDPVTDEQGVQALATDDIVWHVPGANPVSEPTKARTPSSGS